MADSKGGFLGVAPTNATDELVNMQAAYDPNTLTNDELGAYLASVMRVQPVQAAVQQRQSEQFTKQIAKLSSQVASLNGSVSSATQAGLVILPSPILLTSSHSASWTTTVDLTTLGLPTGVGQVYLKALVSIGRSQTCTIQVRQNSTDSAKTLISLAAPGSITSPPLLSASDSVFVSISTSNTIDYYISSTGSPTVAVYIYGYTLALGGSKVIFSTSGGGGGGGGTPSGPAGGDLANTYPNPLVSGIQGTPFSSTAPTDGQIPIFVNADAQWEPKSISGDFALAATGAATLATVNSSPGSFGDASHSLSATVNAKGLITSLSAQSIAISASQVTSGILSLARGGTGSDLSASGAGFLKQATAGATVTVAALSSSDIPSLAASKITGGNSGYVAYDNGSTLAFGALGGDLSGSMPSPTVAKINGVGLGTTTATAGNLLIGSGTQWATQAVSQDLSLTSAGAAKVLGIYAIALDSTTFGSPTDGYVITYNNASGKFKLAAGASGMVYPGAGLPISTGSAWGSSLAYGTAGNFLYSTGSAWAVGAMSGDGSLNGSGTLSVTKINGNSVPSGVVTGDLLYGSASNTLSRLADVATGSYLASGGVGVAPSWATLNATAVGLGNVTNDAQIKASIGTTAGDLITFSGASTPVRLAAVATGSYLASQGTGTQPAWATLNQAAVAGLKTSDSPTFTGLNLSGLTASVPVVTDSSKNLASVSYATFKSSLSIAQADVSGLTTASSPTFTGLNLSGLTASLPVVTDGSKNMASMSYSTFAGNLTAAGDVTGALNANTVVKIQNNAVKSGAPSDQQVLTWINANSRWEATSWSTGVPAANSAGKIIVDQGASYLSKAVSGDATLASTGALTVTGINGVSYSGDPLTQYALLAGRSGGQTLKGDTASGGNLTLQSTNHATRGKINFGSAGVFYYDENAAVVYQLTSGVGAGQLLLGNGQFKSSGNVGILGGGSNVSGTYYSCASIAFAPNESQSSSALGSKIYFNCCPKGSTTVATYFQMDGQGNFQMLKGAIATNATDGFLTITTCAGTPTGTPTGGTGSLIFDTTNNKLYIYNGSWKLIAGGTSGSFTAASGQTVTVTNGCITSII